MSAFPPSVLPSSHRPWTMRRREIHHEASPCKPPALCESRRPSYPSRARPRIASYLLQELHTSLPFCFEDRPVNEVIVSRDDSRDSWLFWNRTQHRAGGTLSALNEGLQSFVQTGGSVYRHRIYSLNACLHRVGLLVCSPQPFRLFLVFSINLNRRLLISMRCCLLFEEPSFLFSLFLCSGGITRF